MKYILAFLFSIVLISVVSCRHISKEIFTESGIVIGRQYTPDTRQVVMGTGMSSNGGFVVTTHSIGDAEKYTTIFRCAHRVIFSIDRIDLYGKLKEGDTVTINYRTVLNSKNEIVDFKFIDANKTKK